MTIRLKMTSKLTREEMQKLPLTEQASLAYGLLGRAADGLTDLGMDPSAIAHAAWDMGHELYARKGGPVKLIRADPRGKQTR